MLAGARCRPARAQSAADSTVAAPVATYTAGQARRGQATYQRNCLECHTAAAYTGVAFRRAWAGRSPFEIWELIRTTMPQDNPGRLKPAEYADIVAYMLRLNGYPAGGEELPADAEQLRSLIIPATPPAGSP
jgi:mono/diheme cytochrome c family protein